MCLGKTLAPIDFEGGHFTFGHGSWSLCAFLDKMSLHICLYETSHMHKKCAQKYIKKTMSVLQSLTSDSSVEQPVHAESFLKTTFDMVAR